MNQQEFIKKVREKTGKDNFQYWTVNHLIKSGVINPKRKGRGRPREFDQEDVKNAVEHYTCREK